MHPLTTKQAQGFWIHLCAVVEEQGGSANDCQRLFEQPAIMQAMVRDYLDGPDREFIVEVPPTDNLAGLLDICRFDAVAAHYESITIQPPKTTGVVRLRLLPINSDTDFHTVETMFQSPKFHFQPGDLWQFLALRQYYPRDTALRRRIIVPGTVVRMAQHCVAAPLFETNDDKTKLGWHWLSDRIKAGAYALAVPR